MRAFFSVVSNFKDYRDFQGPQYEYRLFLFCLLLTEFRNIIRQRHRARWLSGNWRWFRDIWVEITGNNTPETSPSQSTLSRLLVGMDLWALTEQYDAQRRKMLSKSIEETSNLRHYATDVKTREVIAIRTLHDKQRESLDVRQILKRIGRPIPRGVFTGDAGLTSPKLTTTKGATSVIWQTIENTHGHNEVRRLKRIALSRSRASSLSKYSRCGYVYSVESERFDNGLHWVKDAVLGEDSSLAMLNRSSRVLGFFKSIVVSIG